MTYGPSGLNPDTAELGTAAVVQVVQQGIRERRVRLTNPT
jgi:hypothetical protein